jgi:hypothetical protein
MRLSAILILFVSFLYGCGDDTTGPNEPVVGMIIVDSNPDSVRAPWTVSTGGQAGFTGEGDSVLMNVDPGEYSISWGAVEGWSALDDSTDTLVVGDVLRFFGLYRKNGAVQVDTDPDDLNAPWMLIGPNDHVVQGAGDSLVLDAEPGGYTIEWGEAGGWLPPASSVGYVVEAGEITLFGSYTEPGDISIDPNPDSISPPWLIVGPHEFSASGVGDSLFTGMYPGGYTVQWGTIEGWTTPSVEVLDVIGGGMVSFIGDYTVDEVTLHVPVDFPTIQDALNAATEGDVIFVSPGIYTEHIEWPSKYGIKLIGSGEEDCIIDGENAGSVVSIDMDEVGIIDSETVIEGFTIQYGVAYQWGGGIGCYRSSPTLSNLLVQYCDEQGISCHHNSNPRIESVVIRECAYGGIYLDHSNPLISNSSISDNSGPGMDIGSGASPVVVNTKITGNNNIWGGRGGGADIGGGGHQVSFINVEFSRNTARLSGGAMYIHNWDDVYLENVTLADNVSESDGAGNAIELGSYNTLTIKNSILWGDVVQDIDWFVGPNNIYISCSNVQGGWAGDGNMDEDPAYCEPQSQNYYLQSDSPCAPENNDCGLLGAWPIGCEP